MTFSKIKIAAAFALVSAFTACSKDNGAIPERINIQDVPAVSINLESNATTASVVVAPADWPNFSAKLNLSMFFAGAISPTKVDLMACKRNGTTVVKLYKADAALPSNYTLTAADVASLFGGPLVNKDTLQIGPDIYVGATKYEAFPATGSPNGQGVSGMNAVGYVAQLTFFIK